MTEFEDPRSTKPGAPSELVVLVHGLASRRFWMWPLERRLRQHGYDTFKWGYPSLFGSLREYAGNLRRILEDKTARGRQVHVVAHSMGSIVTRLALSYGRLENMGRVVLLAPPNQGSPVARLLAPLVRPICPALSEISSHHDSVVNQIGELDGVEIGVIVARFDTLVPKTNTEVDGQSDWIRLTATHLSLLVQPKAAQQVLSFLSTGCFQH